MINISQKGIKMTKVFILCLCFISFGVYAQQKMSSSMPASAMAPMNFKDQKAKILENLNFSISNMTKNRDCITAANEETALRNCLEKSRKVAEERLKKMNPEAFKRMQIPPNPVKPTK
jgi:hypothetical protein